jgi:hypothetical protein
MVETNISKLLSERTTKIVIIIVLIMLFVQPAFSADSYVDTPTSSDQSLLFVKDIYDSNKNWTAFQIVAK